MNFPQTKPQFAIASIDCLGPENLGIEDHGDRFTWNADNQQEREEHGQQLLDFTPANPDHFHVRFHTAPRESRVLIPKDTM